MSELQKRRLLEAGEAHKAAQHEEEIERLQGQVQEERSRSRLLEAQLMAQVVEGRIGWVRVAHLYQEEEKEAGEGRMGEVEKEVKEEERKKEKKEVKKRRKEKRQRRGKSHQ